MEFYDVLKARRSIRAYTKDPVPGEALAKLADAVNLAPTACNLQPLRFIFVTNADVRAKICSCYGSAWLAEAPVIVVAVGNREEAWKRLDGTSAHTIDVAIAMEHLVLAAAAEGLGTCWVCAYDQEELHRKLGLAPQWDPVAITPLGYAAGEPGPFRRKPVEDIVRYI